MAKQKTSRKLATLALIAAGFCPATAICPASAVATEPMQVITAPNAVVFFQTITQWTADYIRWGFAEPAGASTNLCPSGNISAFCDPDGSYAETYNFGPVFFVTGVAPGVSRTLKVPYGTFVLFPIATIEDTEGPTIPPTIWGFVPPHTYAEEVATVLDNTTFTPPDVELTIDGKSIENLQVSEVPNFFAAIVTPGSEGQVFFTGPSKPLKLGTVLYPSGTKGYWVMIAGLSPGSHRISVSYTFYNPYYGCANGCPSSHAETIEVSEP